MLCATLLAELTGKYSQTIHCQSAMQNFRALILGPVISDSRQSTWSGEMIPVGFESTRSADGISVHIDGLAALELQP